MRINNLKIDSFGKLSSVNIALDEKITVIAGKNEAGKSTVSSFVKYMLYGFDNSKKQNLSDNQRKKYTPWQNDECSGQMDFTCSDGKEYTAFRKTDKRTSTTVFDKNGLPVTNDNAGDFFFGVNEQTYCKTAFIGSSNTAFTDDGELSMAIRNMVYNADESVDSQKALKKLEDIRKYYLGKAERSGRIFEVEKELKELCLERDKWKDGHKELLSSEYQLKQITARIEDNRQKLSSLCDEKENLEYKKAKIKLDNIFSAKQKMEDGKKTFEEHFKLMQNGAFVPDDEYLSRLKQTLSSIENAKKDVLDAKNNLAKARDNLQNVYADKDWNDILIRLNENDITSKELLNQIGEKTEQKKKAKKLALVFTLLVVTIPVAIFFYIKASKLEKELLKLAREYGCADIDYLSKKLSGGDGYFAVENTVRGFEADAKNALDEKIKTAKELENTLSELLSKADVEMQGVDEYVYELEFWLKKTEALKQRCREDFVSYNALCEDVDVQELRALSEKYDERKEIHDEKTLAQKISFYTQAIDALVPKERELEKKAAVLSGTLPKPSEIQSKILSLNENLADMKEKHKALVLAIETLEKAGENMKSEAAPKIASQTSELFSAITDGKYKGLYADSEMKLSFLMSQDAEVRDAGYLSTGTMDAAYISLRIALCLFLYKEKPTLVFDDAFCHMDENRLKNTLDFLKGLSEQFQIVILSCHDREKRYLNGFAKIIDFEI